MIMIKKRLTY